MKSFYDTKGLSNLANETAKQKVDTTEYLINSFDSLSLSVGDVVETTGFYTESGGGGAKWVKTADTSTASQYPVDMNGAQLTTKSGDVFDLIYTVIKPLQFGAVSGLDVDSGPVLNVCANVFRIDAGQPDEPNTVFDGEGLTYRTDESLNFTKIIGKNYRFRDFSVHGMCTGKIVVDFTGCRWGSTRNLKVKGDRYNMPAIGIFHARSSDTSATGFCDGWDIVSQTFGWFSVAGFVAYAQESTNYGACKFWNYNPDGRVAIFTGDDAEFAFSSDYAGIVTGQQSYIQNNYKQIDMRYLSAYNNASIISITKSTTPVVAVNLINEWADGDYLCFTNMEGMGELQSKKYQITNVDVENKTFEIVGLDTTSFGTFTSGRVVKSATVSPVYIGRCQQHSFDGCYIVSYGVPPIELSTIYPITNLSMDFLFEGAGFESLVETTNADSANGIIRCLDFKTYKTLSTTSIFSTSTSYGLDIYDSKISIPSNEKYPVPVFESGFKYKLYGVDITVPDADAFDTSTISYYSGTVKYRDEKIVKLSNVQVPSDDLKSEIVDWVPTLSFSSGTIGSYTVNQASYVVTGSIVNFNLRVTVDDVGTGSTALNITRPPNARPLISAIAIGREILLTGKAVTATIGQDYITVFLDGTSFASGQQFLITGSYTK